MKNYILLVFSLFTLAGFAQSGALDPSFGTAGITLAPSPTGYAEVPSQMLLQPDGKILVFCHRFNEESMIIRFTANGAIDNTFGTNGRYYLQSDTAIYIHSIGLLSSGKIQIVASRGWSYYDSKLYFYRLNANGTPDLTYGNQGEASFEYLYKQFGGASHILPGDTVLTVGSVMFIGDVDQNIFALKTKPDGTPDTNFGTNGLVEYNLTTLGDDYVFKSLLLDDGSIMVGGMCGLDSPNDTDKVYLLKLNHNGTIDSTYGVNGIVKFLFPGSYIPDFDDFAVQPNGKFVFTGTYTIPYQAFVSRLNADGTIDNTFGNNGILLVNTGSQYTLGRQILAQPDGKIIVMGYDDTSGGNTYAHNVFVAKYKYNGDPDSTFGTNGMVITDVTNVFDFGELMLMQPDGKIVVAGSYIDTLNWVDKTFILRYRNSTGVGVGEEPAPVKNISLFPNPAGDYFDVKFDAGYGAKTGTIQLVDMYGRVIKSGQLTNTNRIYPGDVATGVYTVTITDGADVYRGRVVVAR